MSQAQKGFTPLVWIIIATVLLGGGYVALQTFEEKTPSRVTSYDFYGRKPPLPLSDDFIYGADQENAGVLLGDGVSNEYRNEILGFSVRLPKSYSIQSEHPRSISFTSSSGNPLSIHVRDRKSFGLWAKEHWDDELSFAYLDSEILGTTTIAGKEGVMFQAPQGYCDAGECSSPFAGYSLKTPNLLYSLVFFGDSVLSSDEERIKASFTFLETKPHN